jgi:organic radical activating enzyme
MAEISDIYCPLPFGHTLVQTNGSFQVCCQHKTPDKYLVNINQHPYRVWNQSQYLQEIQESFKNNQRHPGCHRCWKNEELGQPSQRTRQLTEYKLLKVIDCSQKIWPSVVEVQLGNLCNLKCLMCNEQDSSALLAENQQLGIAINQQTDFNWTNQGFDNLKQLLESRPKIINIRGGEPFYNKDLLHLIQNLPAESYQQSLLHITTNATRWSPEWKEALKKFKLVRLMLSIDAVDDLYEYIRFPGKWQDVVTNVADMKQCSNVKLLINAVVQNLNILNIGPLIKWSQEQNIHLELDQLSRPEYFVLTNLPDNLKTTACKHIQSVLATQLPDHIRNFLTNCLTQLTNSKFDPVLWQQFQNIIDMRDTTRGNSYKEFLYV